MGVCPPCWSVYPPGWKARFGFSITSVFIILILAVAGDPQEPSQGEEPNNTPENYIQNYHISLLYAPGAPRRRGPRSHGAYLHADISDFPVCGHPSSLPSADASAGGISPCPARLHPVDHFPRRSIVVSHPARPVKINRGLYKTVSIVLISGTYGDLRFHGGDNIGRTDYRFEGAWGR
jgi:hypothetical protein